MKTVLVVWLLYVAMMSAAPVLAGGPWRMSLLLFVVTSPVAALGVWLWRDMRAHPELDGDF